MQQQQAPSPKRPGPKPFDRMLVYKAADEIWNGGKGPVPGLKEVLARVKGATQTVSDALQDWRLSRLGISSAPPVPTAIAKALNDHFESLRREMEAHWQGVVDAGRNDIQTLNECLAERDDEIEVLRGEREQARSSRDEVVGQQRQLSQELELARKSEMDLREQCEMAKLAEAHMRGEREHLLRLSSSLGEQLAEVNRQLDKALGDLASAKADLAVARAERDATFARLGGLPQP